MWVTVFDHMVRVKEDRARARYVFKQLVNASDSADAMLAAAAARNKTKRAIVLLIH